MAEQASGSTDGAGQQLSEKDQQMIEAVKGVTGQTEQPTPAPAQQQAAPAAGDVTGQQPAQEPGAGQQQAPGQPAAQAPVQAQQPVEVKTAFGTQTFGAQGGPVLSSWEDIKSFAKEQGMEIKEADDIRQLFTQVVDLRQQVADIPALQSVVNTYKSQIGSLPPEVMNLVETAIAGKDYKSIIQDLAAGASLDLTRSFDEHNKLNLIRQYASPGLTQEAYDELSDGNKSGLNDIAKSKYETDKTRWQEATRNKAADQEAYQQSFNQSVDVAIQNLQKAFPDMKPEVVKSVKDTMTFGFKDSLFNPDNSYKPDAGIKVAMQEYGQEALSSQQETIGQMAQRMQGKIEGQVNEGLLQRSAAPDQTGRQVVDNSNVVANSVKQATDFLGAK